MPSPDPNTRSHSAIVASNTRMARLDAASRREATAAARAAIEQRFREQADPDGTLPPEEVERRVANLRRAAASRAALAAAKRHRGNAAQRRRQAAAAEWALLAEMDGESA